jgi:hypothetical protein
MIFKTYLYKIFKEILLEVAQHTTPFVSNVKRAHQKAIE